MQQLVIKIIQMLYVKIVIMDIMVMIAMNVGIKIMFIVLMKSQHAIRMDKMLFVLTGVLTIIGEMIVQMNVKA